MSATGQAQRVFDAGVTGWEGIILGRHRKPAKKRGSYFTTGVALEAAALFGFADAIDSHLPAANLLATSIFVDGTKSILGTEEGVPFDRMADSFKGGRSGPGYDERFVTCISGASGSSPGWVVRHTTHPKPKRPPTPSRPADKARVIPGVGSQTTTPAARPG